MASSKAKTVEDYLGELPPERREVIGRVRELIRGSLPDGYRETMSWGMISYEVPLERYPDTYNGQPLGYIALAAQKNYNALYLMGAYLHPEREQAIRDGFQAAGKKLDMGKSCIRFKKVDDLPLDVIAGEVASMPPDQFIAAHEASRRK